jgi:hypothetical protein
MGARSDSCYAMAHREGQTVQVRKGLCSSPERLSGILLCVAFASLAVPVVVTRWPPLLDYPNHFVRIWLLIGGAKIAPLSEMYRVNWHNASTTIGIDLIATFLGTLFPVTVIGPFLVLAAIVLPPLGSVCLNRRIFGGNHWWQLALVLLAWSFTLVAGFLNFQIGLGLALLGAALDPTLVRRGTPTAVIGRFCIGACVLCVHVFALAFYALLIGGLTPRPSPASQKTRRGALHFAGREAVAWLPALAPLVLLLLFAPHLPGAHADAQLIFWQDSRKLGQVLFTPFVTYRPSVDAVFAAVFFFPVVVGFAARSIQVHSRLLLIASLLAALSIFMPSMLFGTGFIDKRLPAMAALSFGAAVRPKIPLARGWHWTAVILVFLVAETRMLWINDVWHGYQKDVASVERALSQVPSGAAVLPLQQSPSLSEIRWKPGRFILRFQPCFWHLSALAVIERHAFIPTLFTAIGKEPLSVLPPWDQIAVPEGAPPNVNQLDDPRAIASFPYLASWRSRFNYILVLNADMPNHDGPLPRDSDIHLVADEGFARLYGISRPMEKTRITGEADGRPRTVLDVAVVE